MSLSEPFLGSISASAISRIQCWIEILRAAGIHTMAEIGVFRGKFAERMLQECGAIEKYYMIDPWRHLENWNKPANKEDDEFAGYFAETKARTEFAAAK